VSQADIVTQARPSLIAANVTGAIMMTDLLPDAAALGEASTRPRRPAVPVSGRTYSAKLPGGSRGYARPARPPAPGQLG
jgi:hypothetical protein